MRYDACVIGAGADGLAAAVTLAKAGLKTIVIERADRTGGRCTTREFHPGFRASPFCDELAPIPATLFWSLDLARRGAIFVPVSPALIGADGAPVHGSHHAHALLAEATQFRRAALSHAASVAASPPQRRSFFSSRPNPNPWPGEAWSERSLAELLAERVPDADEATCLMAAALCGRAADSSLTGSALHLLAPGAGGSGVPMGGLGTLAAVLEAAAREAGTEIACGLEVTDIRRKHGRAVGAGLTDGNEIEAAAVISTLDLKRTFLSLFQWNDLPAPLVKQAAGFRMGGGTARVLVALEAAPRLPPELGRRLHFVSAGARERAAALASCRMGTIPQAPPAALRLASAADPRLAPIGAATLTVTLGSIPFRLFDGAWTNEKRNLLRDRALAAADAVMPGAHAHVLACQVIAPPDFEEALGASEGDLWGGELAPDQMFAMRPFADDDFPPSPRSPIDGLYLAGPSSSAGPFGTCVSGAIAASAVISDFRTGRLR